MKGARFKFQKLILNPSLFAAVILAFTLPVAAREGTPPYSRQQKVQPLGTVQKLVLPPTDVQAELAKDVANGMPTPLRFAVPQKMEVTPSTHGTWERVPDGRLWRLRISSPGATDMNLGFTTFWLPEGATLHISSETEIYDQGPYTAQDNEPHGQLWTPVVPGETAVVELFVPTQAKQEPKLVLSQVGTGFRDFFHKKQDLSPSAIGSCEVDVICPQGDPWRNEIRSVGVYTISGVWKCTGTLVGNTANDFRNFFLTANHCGLNSSNASTVVVYWNYQSPACGMLSGGSLAQNQSGAIFRAARADVDFALIELTQVPSCDFNVYYAGWDRSDAAPSGGVGIHHPQTKEKCISFSTVPLTKINNCVGTGVNTHWNVSWSLGATEPGSSGSGIWDGTTHRDVGFLSGGLPGCVSTPTSCYGRLAVAWGGSDSSSRLSDWLDPLGTGATSIPGLDACVDLSITASDSPDPVAVGNVLTYTLVVSNGSTAAATSVTVTDILPASVTYFTAVPSQGSCSQNGGIVTCSLGPMDTNSSAAITIIVTPTTIGTVTNTTVVTSAKRDKDVTNNTATDVATVVSNCAAANLEFTVTYDGQATNVVYYTDGSWDTITMNGSGTVRIKPYQATTTDTVSFISNTADMDSTNHVWGTATAYNAGGVPFDTLNFDATRLVAIQSSSTSSHFTPGGAYLYFLTYDPVTPPSNDITVYRWEYVSSLNVIRLHVALSSPFYYYPDTSYEYYDFPATQSVCGQAVAHSSLIGTVLGTNALPISGAQVVFGGISRTSDAQGKFQYDDIPPANYLLTISKTGYVTTNRIETIPAFNILQRSYTLFNLPPVTATIQTTPAGKSITVDGTAYAAPQMFTWNSGSAHTIATTSPQSGGTGIQYVWGSWSDGGAMAHTVSPTSNTTYLANFTAQCFLTMAAGAGGSVTPASSWYNSGASVLVTATATNGYSFTNWTGSGSGSYSGANNPTSVSMNGPVAETANFAATSLAYQTWQTQYFGCASCPQSALTADPDGDGQNNQAEFLAGTNPTNSLSSFRILSITPTGTAVRVTWWIGGGRTNVVQATPNLAGTYSNISPNIIIPGVVETATNFLDTGAVTNSPIRFYRIQLAP